MWTDRHSEAAHPRRRRTTARGARAGVQGHGCCVDPAADAAEAAAESQLHINVTNPTVHVDWMFGHSHTIRWEYQVHDTRLTRMTHSWRTHQVSRALNSLSGHRKQANTFDRAAEQTHAAATKHAAGRV